MIDTIKQIEDIVVKSINRLENIEIKEKQLKQIGNRGNTNIRINVSFENSKLNWIYVTLQWKIDHQFCVILSRYWSNEWNVSIQLSNNFYDLGDKDINRRVDFFLNNYDKVVEALVNDENAARRKELIDKQREIQSELSKLL